MESEMNIIIHGFGGTTGDVAHLEDFMSTEGLLVHVPLLAGHGGRKKELAASTPAEWIESVRIEIAKHLESHDKVNLLGFSMGSFIAVHLAAEYGAEKIGKIVLINTPIHFWNTKVIAKDLAAREKGSLTSYVNKAVSKGIKSGMDFLSMLSNTKKTLSDANLMRIMPATLIVQSANDETVRPKSAEYIRLKMGDIAQVKYYENVSHHIFTKNIDFRDTICQDICDFIKGI